VLGSVTYEEIMTSDKKHESLLETRVETLHSADGNPMKGSSGKYSIESTISILS